MKLNKYYVLFFICSFFSIVITIFLTHSTPHTLFRFPVSEEQISSVSIYYSNISKKKEIFSESEIAYIMSYANERTYITGTYQKIPTGGQTFFILFHLIDGTDFPCIYYQTTEFSGYYVDGRSKVTITSLNFIDLWLSLECKESLAFAEHEFSSWPTM